MASFLYNKAKAEILRGNIPWVSSTLKMMLVTASYSPNPDHDFVSSASGNELSGTGYIAGFGGSGRHTLTGKTVTEDDSNDRAVADADDVTWLAINAGTAAAGIIIKEVTSDADSILVAYMDIADVATNGGDLSLQFNIAGVFFS